MKQARRITAIAAFVFGAGAVQAADIVIGVPNWPSVNATAHVLKVIIEGQLRHGRRAAERYESHRLRSHGLGQHARPSRGVGCRTRRTCTTSSSSRRVRCS